MDPRERAAGILKLLEQRRRLDPVMRDPHEAHKRLSEKLLKERLERRMKAQELLDSTGIIDLLVAIQEEGNYLGIGYGDDWGTFSSCGYYDGFNYSYRGNDLHISYEANNRNKKRHLGYLIHRNFLGRDEIKVQLDTTWGYGVEIVLRENIFQEGEIATVNGKAVGLMGTLDELLVSALKNPKFLFTLSKPPSRDSG